MRRYFGGGSIFLLTVLLFVLSSSSALAGCCLDLNDPQTYCTDDPNCPAQLDCSQVSACSANVCCRGSDSCGTEELGACVRNAGTIDYYITDGAGSCARQDVYGVLGVNSDAAVEADQDFVGITQCFQGCCQFVPQPGTAGISSCSVRAAVECIAPQGFDAFFDASIVSPSACANLCGQGAQVQNGNINITVEVLDFQTQQLVEAQTATVVIPGVNVYQISAPFPQLLEQDPIFSPGPGYIIEVQVPGYQSVTQTGIVMQSGINTFSFQLTQAAETGVVRGTVVDEQNNPVQGASVAYAGGVGNPATTNALGEFVLDVPVGTHDIVVFGVPGYQIDTVNSVNTQQLTVASGDNPNTPQDNVQVALEPQAAGGLCVGGSPDGQYDAQGGEECDGSLGSCPAATNGQISQNLCLGDCSCPTSCDAWQAEYFPNDETHSCIFATQCADGYIEYFPFNDGVNSGGDWQSLVLDTQFNAQDNKFGTDATPGCCFTECIAVPTCLEGSIQNSASAFPNSNFCSCRTVTPQNPQGFDRYYDMATDTGYCCNGDYSTAACASLSIGSLEGYVYSDSGTPGNPNDDVPIDSAIVIASKQGGGQDRITLTDQNGRYTLVTSPGTYTLEVRKIDHTTTPFNQLLVTSQNGLVNDPISVAASQSTVVSTAATPQVLPFDPDPCNNYEADLVLENVQGETDIEVTIDMDACFDSWERIDIYRKRGSYNDPDPNTMTLLSTLTPQLGLCNARSADEGDCVLLDTAINAEFPDDELFWETDYTYKAVITAQNPISTYYVPLWDVKNTGDALCEGLAPNDYFCMNDSTYITKALANNLPAVPTIRTQCDVNNQPVNDPDDDCNFGTPAYPGLNQPWYKLGGVYDQFSADQFCRSDVAEGAVCIGYDQCRALGVPSAGDQGPYPPYLNFFGLFYDIDTSISVSTQFFGQWFAFWDSSSQQFVDTTCEYTVAGEERNCYLDYYSSESLVYQDTFSSTDRCLNCELEGGSCYDYQSQRACELNHCGYGDNADCQWYDSNETYGEYGRGFCYQADYTGTDTCSLCQTDNDILFGNAGCSAEVCVALGACYSNNDQTSCNSCDQLTACEDLRDEVSCLGANGGTTFDIPLLTVTHLDGTVQNNVDCPSHFAMDQSGDACMIGTCKWDANFVWPNNDVGKCYKDADDDDIEDSVQGGAFTDSRAPKTLLKTRPTVVTLANDFFSFEFENGADPAADLYYCVTESGAYCCPDTQIPANGNTFDLQLLSSTPELLDKEGSFDIWYYAVDGSHNVEQMRKATLTVDAKKPVIDVIPTSNPNVQTMPPPPENNYDSLLNIEISVPADEGAVYECLWSLEDGMNVLADDNDTFSLGPGQSTIVLAGHNIYEGLYEFHINCRDGYGNWMSIPPASSIIPLEINNIFTVDEESIRPYGTTTSDNGQIRFEFLTEDDMYCRFRDITQQVNNQGPAGAWLFAQEPVGIGAGGYGVPCTGTALRDMNYCTVQGNPQATCTNAQVEAICTNGQQSFSDGSRYYYRSEAVSVANGQTAQYEFECNDGGSTDTAMAADAQLLAHFYSIVTIDDTAPTTTFTLKIGDQFEPILSNRYYKNLPQFHFRCQDPDIDVFGVDQQYNPQNPRGSLGEFGCAGVLGQNGYDTTEYCVDPTLQGCTPSKTPSEIANEFQTSGQYLVEFSSTDWGGNNEPVDSVTVNVDHDKPELRYGAMPFSDTDVVLQQPVFVDRADQTITIEVDDLSGIGAAWLTLQGGGVTKLYKYPFAPADAHVFEGPLFTTATSVSADVLLPDENTIATFVVADNVYPASDRNTNSITIPITFDAEDPDIEDISVNGVAQPGDAIEDVSRNSIDPQTFEEEQNYVQHQSDFALEAQATDASDIIEANALVSCLEGRCAGMQDIFVLLSESQPDTYTADMLDSVHQLETGLYETTFTVVDAAFNQRSQKVFFEIKDTIAPTFSIWFEPHQDLHETMAAGNIIREAKAGPDSTQYTIHILTDQPLREEPVLWYEFLDSSNQLIDTYQGFATRQVGALEYTTRISLRGIPYEDLDPEQTGDARGLATIHVEGYDDHDVKGTFIHGGDQDSGANQNDSDKLRLDSEGPAPGPNMISPQEQAKTVFAGNQGSATGIGSDGTEDIVYRGGAFDQILMTDDYTSWPGYYTISNTASAITNNPLVHARQNTVGDYTINRNTLDEITLVNGASETQFSSGMYIEFEGTDPFQGLDNLKRSDGTFYEITNAQVLGSDRVLTISPPLEQDFGDVLQNEYNYRHTINVYNQQAPDGYFSFTNTLDEGDTHFRTWSRDEHDNEGPSSDYFTLTRDATPPVVLGVSPTQTTGTLQPEVRFDVQDISGVDSNSVACSIRPSGGSYAPFVCNPICFADRCFVSGFPGALQDQTLYEVEVQADDINGNTVVSGWSFSVDSSIPSFPNIAVTNGNLVDGTWYTYLGPAVRVTFPANEQIVNPIQIRILDAQNNVVASATPSLVQNLHNEQFAALPADGAYTIEVQATRQGGNLGTYVVPLVIDTVDPALAPGDFSITPSESLNVPTTSIAEVALLGTFNDEIGLVQAGGDLVFPVGQGVPFPYDSIELPMELLDTQGTETIGITVYDLAGNQQTLQLQAELDLEGPSLSITDVEGGVSIGAQESLLLSIEEIDSDVMDCSDGDGGIDPYTRGQLVDNNFAIIVNDTCQGDYLVEYYCVDQGGWQGTSKMIYCDAGCSVGSCDIGNYSTYKTSEDIVNITGTSDGDTVYIDRDHSSATTPANQQFFTQKILNQGPRGTGETSYVTQVTSRDAVGNPTDIYLNIIKDLSGPAIALLPPTHTINDWAKGITLETSEPSVCTITYTVAGNNYVDQQMNSVDELTHTAPVQGAAAAGINSVEFSATCEDIVGNAAEETFTLKYDPIAPVLHSVRALSSLETAPGQFANGIGTTRLAVSASEPVLCTYDDGVDTLSFENEYETTVRTELLTLALGQQTYTVICEDGAGNQAPPVVVTVTYDPNLPIQIFDLQPSPYVGTADGVHPTFSFKTYVDGACDINEQNLGFFQNILNLLGLRGQLTVLDPQLQDDAYEYEFDYTPTMEEGDHTFRVDCSKDNRTGNKSFEVTADYTPPGRPVLDDLASETTVGIIHPKGVAANNEQGIYIDLFINDVKVDRDVTDHQGRFSFTNIQLEEGDNDVYVVGIDPAGNTGYPSWPTQEVAYESTGPRVTAITPLEGEVMSSFIGTIQAKVELYEGIALDASQTTISVVKQDPGGNNVDLYAQGLASLTASTTDSLTVTVDPQHRGDGTYTVSITPVDTDSNVGATSISTFTVDSSVPDVTLSSPYTQEAWYPWLLADVFTAQRMANLQDTIAFSGSITSQGASVSTASLTVLGNVINLLPQGRASFSFDTPVFIPSDGDHVFTFSAVDANGNEAIRKGVIKVDTTGPIVCFSSDDSPDCRDLFAQRYDFSSPPDYRIERPEPRVAVVFDESIELASLQISSIYNDTDESVNGFRQDSTREVSDDVREISYLLNQPIAEGDYYFTVQATDIYGNVGDGLNAPLGGPRRVDITMEIPPIQIELVNPEQGVAASTPGNALINAEFETDLTATCKYTEYTGGERSTYEDEFDNLSFTLAGADTTTHTGSIQGSVAPRNFIVVCEDQYGRIAGNSEVFALSVDYAAPEITSAALEPGSVEDEPLADIVIATANEETRCRYLSGNSVAGQNFDPQARTIVDSVGSRLTMSWTPQGDQHAVDLAYPAGGIQANLGNLGTPDEHIIVASTSSNSYKLRFRNAAGDLIDLPLFYLDQSIGYGENAQRLLGLNDQVPLRTGSTFVITNGADTHAFRVVSMTPLLGGQVVIEDVGSGTQSTLSGLFNFSVSGTTYNLDTRDIQNLIVYAPANSQIVTSNGATISFAQTSSTEAQVLIDEPNERLMAVSIGPSPDDSSVLTAQTATVGSAPNSETVDLFSQQAFIQQGFGSVYDTMRPFSGYNQNTFANNHRERVGTPSNPGTYNYYVMCEDRAGHRSDLETITYSVNLGAPFTLSVSSQPFSQTTDIELEVATNKRAQCFYSEDPQDPAANVFNSLSQTQTSFGSGTFQTTLGLHTFYIMCNRLAKQETATAQFKIAVDTTPPIMNLVDVSDQGLPLNPGFGYKTDELHVVADANETEEPLGIEVVKYEYLIYKEGNLTNELIANISSTESDLWISGLQLEDGGRYFVQVRAINTAGLKSDPLDSATVTIDTSLTPDQCANSLQDGSESDVDCGGTMCGGCLVGASCSTNSDCASLNCETGPNGTGVCAPAVQGGECLDGNLNGDETDIDCGGTCPALCQVGQMCAFDTDCDSGLCENGFCSENACFNGQLDDGESDVDCGGSCAIGCAEGLYCEEDADCLSNNCAAFVCETLDLTDLDGDGIPNEEDDDIDGDGIVNWEDPDDDNDGQCDTEDSPLNMDETGALLCEGNDLDDDGDGIEDSQDYDTDNDLDNDGTINEQDEDMDGDGIPNSEDLDNDNDGIPDAEDFDDDNDGTNDDNEDNDADGIPNKWEDSNLLNKDDERDALTDNDNDGLNNLDEFKWGTDPNNPDTDGDGWNDGDEVERGTNPLDPEDKPTGFVPILVTVTSIVAVLGAGGYLGYTYFEPLTGMSIQQAGQRLQSFFTGKRPPQMPGKGTPPPQPSRIPRRSAPRPPQQVAQQAARRTPESVVQQPKQPEEEYVNLSELGKKSSKPSAISKLDTLGKKSSTAGKAATESVSKQSKSFEKLSMLSHEDIPKKGALFERLSKDLGAPVNKDTFGTLQKIANKDSLSKTDVTSAFSKLDKLNVSSTHKKNLFKNLVKSNKLGKQKAMDALDSLAKKKVITKKSKESIMKSIRKIAEKK